MSYFSTPAGLVTTAVILTLAGLLQIANGVRWLGFAMIAASILLVIRRVIVPELRKRKADRP
jgi:hypothetical protein